MAYGYALARGKEKYRSWKVISAKRLSLSMTCDTEGGNRPPCLSVAVRTQGREPQALILLGFQGIAGTQISTQIQLLLTARNYTNGKSWILEMLETTLF